MQPSCLHVPHYFVHLGEATHRRAEDGEELEEDQADVERGVAAGGGAAGDQAPAARQDLERLLEGLAADVLENDVDAALAGQPPHLGGEVELAVEDRLLR